MGEAKNRLTLHVKGDRENLEILIGIGLGDYIWLAGKHEGWVEIKADQDEAAAVTACFEADEVRFA